MGAWLWNFNKLRDMNTIVHHRWEREGMENAISPKTSRCSAIIKIETIPARTASTYFILLGRILGKFTFLKKFNLSFDNYRYLYNIQNYC